MKIMSRGGKRYVCVIMDGYSRFTWTLSWLLKIKLLKKLLFFFKKVEKRVGNSLVCLRFDHGTEFENSRFIDYCNEQGVDHNFSTPRTL